MTADSHVVGRITSEAQWELELHRTATHHLSRCREAFWEMEEGDKDVADIDDPSFAPYDDCDDCVVREVLMVAWPAIEERFGAEAEDLRRQLAARDAAYANACTEREVLAAAVAPEQLPGRAASGTTP